MLFVISYLLYVPQPGKILTKLDDPNYTKFGSFWQKPEKVSACETNNEA